MRSSGITSITAPHFLLKKKRCPFCGRYCYFRGDDLNVFSHEIMPCRDDVIRVIIFDFEQIAAKNSHVIKPARRLNYTSHWEPNRQSFRESSQVHLVTWYVYTELRWITSQFSFRLINAVFTPLPLANISCSASAICEIRFATEYGWQFSFQLRLIRAPYSA